MKYEDIERKSLGEYPTPMYKLENISRDYECNIYIKRDDLCGIGFGGNKVRKLEFITKEAIDNGYTSLLTFGDLQTNHGMLTSAIAGKLGMKPILVLGVSEENPDLLTGNILLDNLLDADIRFFRYEEVASNWISEYLRKKQELTEKIVKEYEDKGEKVYIIPGGGSSHLGALGYVNAVSEIKEQLKVGHEFDYIICGQGSKGTYAGLLLGTKYYGLNSKVYGINIERTFKGYENKMKDFINEISDKYEMDVQVDENDIFLTDDYVGLGYAVPDESTFNAIKYLAKRESIFTDPVYTGKVFKGIIDLIDKGIIKKGSNVLFIHTGGLPGIFNNNNMEYVTSKQQSR